MVALSFFILAESGFFSASNFAKASSATANFLFFDAASAIRRPVACRIDRTTLILVGTPVALMPALIVLVAVITANSFLIKSGNSRSSK